jgi:small subunit ribosomal protein S17
MSDEATTTTAAATPAPAKAADERAARKVRTGMVVSDKMDKTVLVKIDQTFTHPTYGKTVRRSSKFAAHDEANDAHIGDTVKIMETRRLSKTKRWRVIEVLERAK